MRNQVTTTPHNGTASMAHAPPGSPNERAGTHTPSPNSANSPCQEQERPSGSKLPMRSYLPRRRVAASCQPVNDSEPGPAPALAVIIAVSANGPPIRERDHDQRCREEHVDLHRRGAGIMPKARCPEMLRAPKLRRLWADHAAACILGHGGAHHRGRGGSCRPRPAASAGPSWPACTARAGPDLRPPGQVPAGTLGPSGRPASPPHA